MASTTNMVRLRYGGEVRLGWDRMMELLGLGPGNVEDHD